MAYIIDADWIIEISRGNRAASQIAYDLATDEVMVSWLTLGEIYEVAFGTPHPQAQLERFHQLLTSFSIVGVDGPTMERFAEIRAYLRRTGQMISDFDIVLAATALRHDLTVLTYNLRHFERVPDIRIYRAG